MVLEHWEVCLQEGKQQALREGKTEFTVHLSYEEPPAELTWRSVGVYYLEVAGQAYRAINEQEVVFLFRQHGLSPFGWSRIGQSFGEPVKNLVLEQKSRHTYWKACFQEALEKAKQEDKNVNVLTIFHHESQAALVWFGEGLYQLYLRETMYRATSDDELLSLFAVRGLGEFGWSIHVTEKEQTPVGSSHWKLVIKRDELRVQEGISPNVIPTAHYKKERLAVIQLVRKNTYNVMIDFDHHVVGVQQQHITENQVVDLLRQNAIPLEDWE